MRIYEVAVLSVGALVACSTHTAGDAAGSVADGATRSRGGATTSDAAGNGDMGTTRPKGPSTSDAGTAAATGPDAGSPDAGGGGNDTVAAPGDAAMPADAATGAAADGAPAALTADGLTITAPATGATVSSTVSVDGQAGSEWVNVAVYDASGAKIGSDVMPSNGVYSVAVDTTQLPEGTQTITVEAFSVPAGQPGGTSRSVTVTVNVQNAAAPTAATGFPIVLGVNTHVFYNSYLSYDAQQVQTMLAYLGITHIRDVLPDSSQFSQLDGIVAQGVGLDLIVAVGGAVDVSDTVGQLNALVTAFPGSLDFIEGPNEVFNWPITYNGAGGFAGAASYQSALYSALKSTVPFTTIPVYNLSLGGGDPTSMPNLSDGCDFGNAHLYPQPNWGAAPGPSMAANVPYENVDTPSKPNVITEGGYYTMPDDQYGVNEDVQARYSLDFVMDAIIQNVQALYFYDIVDDAVDPGNTNMEDHFGLFDSSYSPKPAATALHNLTTILNGTTVSAATYSVTGLPSSGHTLSLSGANGATYLVVWAEPEIWDQSTDTETVGAVVEVTADLGSTRASVTVFDPLVDASPAASYSNSSSVQLGVTDHPLIVEMN